ncbi:MAG: hypothetical protein AAFX07_02325 [Pseudomonadota bacterium]
MSEKHGFWSGMSSGLKAWTIAALLYFGVSAYLFLKEPILGTVLFVLPAFWILAKNYLLAHLFLKTDFERANTLSGYTINFLLFRASTLTKTITGVALLGAVIFGLGWVSTEDLRLEAAKPTLTERVTGTASAAVNATTDSTRGWAASAKETTGNWVSTAKGWFSDDEAQTAEAE